MCSSLIHRGPVRVAVASVSQPPTPASPSLKTALLAWALLTCGALLSLAALPPPAAGATGKAQIYVARMEPYGRDAERYSKAAWGGGISGILSGPQVLNMLSLVVGLEGTNLLNQTREFRDQLTGLRVEQQTDQSYFRLYLGTRFGPQGHGFIRPHAGTHVALVNYGIGTDVVVPDDTDREREIRQQLSREDKYCFGYDFTVGVDWNIADRIPIETGVRYLKSFNVPQQLGEGSVKIAPEYFQMYLGIGLNLWR